MEKLLPDISANSMGSAVAAGRYRPYPAYRDSGVEWLGDIPAHWGLKRLRFAVSKCQNGLWGDESDGESDVVCVRVADFDRVTYRVKADHLTLRSVNRSILRTHGLNSGDLLLEKSGGGDNQPVGTVVLNTYGEAAVCSNFVARMPVKDEFDSRYLTYVHAALYAARVNSRSIRQNTGIQNLDSQSYLNEFINQDMKALKLDEGVDARYFGWLLDGISHQILAAAIEKSGHGTRAVRMDEWRSVELPLPPILEQRSIVEFLHRETSMIDALVAKVHEAIDHLKELRTALISAAVTGKIDVRVAVP